MRANCFLAVHLSVCVLPSFVVWLSFSQIGTKELVSSVVLYVVIRDFVCTVLIFFTYTRLTNQSFKAILNTCAKTWVNVTGNLTEKDSSQGRDPLFFAH